MMVLDYVLSFRNTGLKWSNPDFSVFLDEQVARVRIRKPSVFIIDGIHGGGKTTLASHCAQYIEDSLGCVFDYEQQVGKGMDKFLERLSWVKKNGRHVAVYDEAEDFERKGAVSRFNRLLNRVFSVLRATGIVVIIVLGIVKKLEKEPIEKGLVRALVNVHNRGDSTADVRVYDAANIFYLMFLMERYLKTGKPPLMAYSRTQPVFRSRILKADPDDERQWDLIDLREKGCIMDNAALQQQGLIDLKTVAKESGYSVSSLRIKFRSLKPEAVKLGIKNYYYRSILERLKN